jgi:hypothetical protein
MHRRGVNDGSGGIHIVVVVDPRSPAGSSRFRTDSIIIIHIRRIIL